MTRDRWRPALMGALLMAAACRPGLDETERAGLDAWLHCDECTDQELAYVRDSLGMRARDALREALRSAHEPLMPVMDSVLASEHRRVEGSTVGRDEFVNHFMDNYRAAVRRRAAVAMGAIGDTVGLREAMESPAFVGYRADVRDVIARARVNAGVVGLALAAPDRVVMRPPALDLPPGGTGRIEAIVIDTDGKTISPDLVWSTGDAGIASVTSPRRGEGEVTATSTLGTTTVTATVDGTTVSGTTAVTVAAAAPAPDVLRIISGDRAHAASGAAFPPSVVELTTSTGAPISGATVTWSITRGSATPTSATGSTDATGRTSLTVTAGANAGTVWLVATSGRASVRFTLIVDP